MTSAIIIKYCDLTDSHCACVVTRGDHGSELCPHLAEPAVTVHGVGTLHGTARSLLRGSAQEK